MADLPAVIEIEATPRESPSLTNDLALLRAGVGAGWRVLQKAPGAIRKAGSLAWVVITLGPVPDMLAKWVYGKPITVKVEVDELRRLKNEIGGQLDFIANLDSVGVRVREKILTSWAPEHQRRFEAIMAGAKPVRPAKPIKDRRPKSQLALSAPRSVPGIEPPTVQWER